jgi:hypothetical protein
MHAVARFGFGVVSNFTVEQDLVSEGAKHLFSLCEKRYFAPFQNRLRLIWTVQLKKSSIDGNQYLDFL